MSVPSGQPVPQGDYIPAKRHGELIFSSGMTPRRASKLMFSGCVRADVPLESYKEAVILACSNALAATHGMLCEGERLATVLSLTVYICSEPDFTAHSKLADYASQYLRSELGHDGIGSRTAVGVATLPDNAPVEIQIIAAICPKTPR